jgi:hypothetical protein
MQTQKPTPIFLTEPEAANILRLSKRSLQRYRQLGEGPPFVKIGFRRLVYPRDHLLAWAYARRCRSMSEVPADEGQACSDVRQCLAE